MSAISRRDFLRVSSQGVLTLALGQLSLSRPGLAGESELARPVASQAQSVEGLTPAAPYGDWRDLYGEAWSWDRVAKGTHSNVNCVSTCAWNLYVRDEVVWREEQAGSYDDGCAQCPDFNPRGCQKGASSSHLFLGPSRLRYPIERVGERGEGRWKRISWQQALDKAAAGLVSAVEREGGHGVIAEVGPELGYGPNSAAPLRFFKMLGAPITDSMAMIGDIAFGGTITLGTAHTDGSSDDWFRSDYIVLWAFNPVQTRIPDAHFLTEARYRGARVVGVSPDYNASSIHCDLWLNPRAGSDAALALAAVQVIVSEGLHDQAYLREQTDLPLLVRRDNGRFLRAADMLEGGSEQVFYAWDTSTAALVKAPGTKASGSDSLEWGEAVAALEGRWRVSALDGEIEVEPVFERLRAQLDRDYTPEKSAQITGVPAAAIRRFAREFAGARSALILSQYGGCKFYHSDLMQRAQILLASVTGNIGRAGGGWRSGAFVALEGMAVLAMQKDLGLLDLLMLATRSFFREPEENLADFARYFVPSGLWHYVHGGLDRDSAKAAYGDPMLAEGPGPYVREALDKGWFPIDRGRHPSFMLSIFGNVLRHSRNAGRLREQLWPRLETIVSVDFRMSQTAAASDIVVPAAGWYEKVDFKYIPALAPYITLGDRAVAPYAEAKPEWEIFHGLATAVSRIAKQRGVDGYSDYLGVERRLAELASAFSDDGRFGPNDEDKLAEFILTVSSPTRGISLEELRRDGHRRIVSTGQQGGTTGIFSEYAENEPIVPMRWFVEEKRPYPTLTGRQQFYVDHRWFIELDEALPRYKAPPAIGGDYPLTLSGGHARWSVHAIWRDHELMLRLQRGEPLLLLGVADARERGIADHNRVRVFNDVSSFVANAKVVSGNPPGFAMVYHAWEPFQFEGGRSHQDVAPAPMKVTQLAGDYGHLHWTYAHYEPGQVDRDTRVEVTRLG